MDTSLKSIIERLQQANNILVTVSKNPSVDQLSACVGITLMLNKLNKHATAVFSGEVPSTLEFLEPEATIETNTDSLRDFIISLDKSKADKLRYKVEDEVVKIFITPYRTSLTESDLEFSQGDFNVEAILALGVHEKEDLDQAIIAHGRILHDATVICVNTQFAGGLGSINWVNPKTSSLSEMMVVLSEALSAEALDAQMSNSFLTGIVAETERFSNEKTASTTMNISAKLIAAGANQQLVASKLQEQQAPQAAESSSDVAKPDDAAGQEETPDGSLRIKHDQEDQPDIGSLPDLDAGQAELPSIDIDQKPEIPSEDFDGQTGLQGPRIVTQPPTLGGTLTANSRPEALDPVTDPMSLPATDTPLLSRDKLKKGDGGDEASQPEPPAQAQAEEPEQPEKAQDTADRTLADLEKAVEESEKQEEDKLSPENARDAVNEAISNGDQPLQPTESLNAQAVDLEIPHEDDKSKEDNNPAETSMPNNNIKIDPVTGEIQFAESSTEVSDEQPKPAQDKPAVTDSTAPPPVPPPMMPPPPPMPPPSGQDD